MSWTILVPIDNQIADCFSLGVCSFTVGLLALGLYCAFGGSLFSSLRSWATSFVPVLIFLGPWYFFENFVSLFLG